jgi:hypothetical protein
MTEKIALHRIAESVELQSEVLSCLILRVAMLEAQVEQMQQTIDKNRRRSIKVMYRDFYEATPSSN